MKGRILLVDDELDLVKLVRKRLETEGFEVSVALTGKEALARAPVEQPDAIVLDIMLPEMSGLEVCAKLKNDERAKRIPVIIYTGKGRQGDEALCRELGADGYVPKSAGTGALIQHISSLLPKR